MHRGPECPIGEAIIVFLTIKRRQVHKHVLDISFADYSELRARLGSNPAAPAEPKSLIGLKCLSQCNGQATGCSLGRGVRNGYTVRNNNEARQRSAPTHFLVKRRSPMPRAACDCAGTCPSSDPTDRLSWPCTWRRPTEPPQNRA